MAREDGPELVPRFYLEGTDLEGVPVSAEMARQVGLPVSPVGPPLPGMGRVFVSYAGDLNNVWAHWEDGKRYVFFSGTYGEALLWALSQPAKEHHVPVPRSRDTVEVRPHRARSE